MRRRVRSGRTVLLPKRLSQPAPTLKPAGPDEGEFDKLGGAIAEAAGLLRTYTVGYLTVALYLVVTAVNTTHEHF